MAYCGICRREIDIPPYVAICREYVYKLTNWKALIPFVEDGVIPDILILCRRCDALIKKHGKKLEIKHIKHALGPHYPATTSV